MVWYVWILVVLVLLIIIRKIWPVYLGGIDSIFLAADPLFRTTIHAIMETSTPVSRGQLKAFIEGGFSHPRFQQRVVKRTLLWHYYTRDVHYNVDNHIFCHRMKDESSHGELEALVSNLLVTGLDASRPLWQFHLVENHRGGSVLIFRIHHCQGDGVGMMRFAVAMMKREMEAAAAAAAATVTNGASISSSSSFKARASRHSGGKKSKPSPLRVIWRGMKAASKLLLLPADPVSPLKHNHILTADTPVPASWSENSIDLALVKRVAKANNATINDLLFAVLAGAFGTYMRRHNLPLPTNSIQSVLWVSLRGTDIDGPPAFSNDIGAVYLKLPVQEVDAIKRVDMVRKQTAELVTSPEPFVAALFMRAFGLLPLCIAQPIWYLTAFKVSTSTSNLPGPALPLAIGGAPIRSFVFFVPPSRTIGHFATVLSYNNTIMFGFASDSRLISEPKKLVEYCHHEIHELDRLISSSSSPVPATTSKTPVINEGSATVTSSSSSSSSS